MTHTPRGFRAIGAAVGLILLLASAAPAAAQTREEQLLRRPPQIAGEEVVDPTVRLQLANADSNYPVTPGDVYTLTYLRAGEIIVTELTVENDYSINLNIFGRIDASNLTFTQLRPRITQVVEQAIPRSLPSVSMVSVGVFRVRLVGALAQSRSVTAWGLSRLSDVVRAHLAPYSSIRSITVISRTGERRTYDLFRAIDLGDESQDPYVRPGDTVELSRVDRAVYVGGEVNQAGRLELAPDDTMTDILRFVRGVSNRGDPSRVRVTRAENGTVRTHFLNLTDGSGALEEFALLDGDIIRVPSLVTDRPIVYVEGQIAAPAPPAVEPAPAPTVPGVPVVPDIIEPLPVTPAAAAVPGYGRVVVPIGRGETLYGVLDRVSGDISPRADLTRAQLLRGGRPVELPVSIEQLLFSYRPEHDVPLEPFDRIVLPRDPSTPPDGEPSVLITGGVNVPGQYPVLPGMDAYAHIRQAGGFDREINANEQFRIYDSEGRRKDNAAPIEPGDHIEVLRNNFVYSFNRHFPIIATGVGFLATIVATLALFGP